MDCPEVRARNTVYLGVSVPGALLSFGDGHYAQGDGEIIGTAVEGAMNVEVTVDLIKGRETPWPRIENAEWMMSGGRRAGRSRTRRAWRSRKWCGGSARRRAVGDGRVPVRLAERAGARRGDGRPEYTVMVKIEKKRLPTRSRHGIRYTEAREVPMNKDEIKGKAQNVKGRVKEAAGTLTGNPELESEGASERARARSARKRGRRAARSAKLSRTSEKRSRGKACLRS